MPIKKKSHFLKSILNFLWPIERGETIKCLSLISLVFLISFNYTILKALKDPLIITAENSTALVLPFLKTWAVLPSALLGATLFTWLCNRFGFQKTFYTLISIFLLYFILFTTFLYPNKESLYLGSKSLLMAKSDAGGSWINYSAFFRTFYILLYYWPLSTFYVMAELWSSIVLSVLFWGFANHITPLFQAKRFYGVINLMGNISGFIAGMVSYYFNAYSQDNMFIEACCAWDHTLYGLMALIIVATVLILAVFHFAHTKFPSPNEVKTALNSKKKKAKMGMSEAFAKCFQSKYIFSIAFIVLAYNLSMNILEILWKDQTNALYPKVSDYHNYMSHIAMLIGVFSTLFGFMISGFLRVFKWKNTALFTPLILSCTSLLFFFAFFLHYFGYHSVFNFIGLTPLAVVVFIGGIQNSICRSAKFTFFDTTKELAFIPLSKDDKIKAKAVIDGIGSRLGKSGGAVAVQILVFFLPTVSAMAPFFMLLLIPMLSGWFYSINHINGVFEKYDPEEESTSPA